MKIRVSAILLSCTLLAQLAVAQPSGDAPLHRRDYQLALQSRAAPAPPQAHDLEAQVRQIIGNLDAQGRWISKASGELMAGQPRFRKGQAYIGSDVFARNVETLCQYLQSRN